MQKLYPLRSTFRLQYASNLFVDSHRRPFEELVQPFPKTSTLALLGNIGRPDDSRTFRFLEYCVKNWDHVLWILGPHEISNPKGDKKLFYQLTDHCVTLANYFPDHLRILNHDDLFLTNENVALVGATLWTHGPQYMRAQPEFSTILKDRKHTLTPKIYSEWHKEDTDFLYIRGRYYNATEATAPLIFLTHHLPISYLMNTGLSRRTYVRTSLDINNYQHNIRPGISVWLAGATGSCSSGYFGPEAGRQTFCAVNSCYEYPYREGLKPHPGYYTKMVVEVKTVQSGNKPVSAYPPVHGLPPLVSSMFKPKVSHA